MQDNKHSVLIFYFDFMGEILWWENSKQTSLKIISHGMTYFLKI